MGNCYSQVSDEVRKFCTSKPTPTDPTAQAKAPVADKASPLLASSSDQAVAKRAPAASVEPKRRRKDPNWSEVNATWSIVFDDKNKPKPCPICVVNILHFENRQTWEIAHVKSFKDGGDDTVANWRPVCRRCNRSMQETHMLAYCRDKVKPERLQEVIRMLRLEPFIAMEAPSAVAVTVPA